MSSESTITAAETPAANGHGEAHSTAGFKALMLGSIGVVYGDIGTSPLYALREAIVAASGSEGGVTTQAVLGVLSLILWALIVVVTLKYVVILLRADNHGEGGTLALMALAQRAVSKGAGAVGTVGDRRHQARHRHLRSLCRAADRDHPAGAVCGSIARHGAGRGIL